MLKERGSFEKDERSKIVGLIGRRVIKKPRIAPRLNMLIYYHLSQLQNKTTNSKKKKSKESSKSQSLCLLHPLSSQTASAIITPPILLSSF